MVYVPGLEFARERVGRLLDASALRNMPPVAKAVVERLLGRPIGGDSPDKQALDIYWDPKMAALLETWGNGNAWDEIQMLLMNARGTVLDIACGTGKVMQLLERYPAIEVHGFDISDFLIQKAVDRGISKDRLRVEDATKTTYSDDAFDYSYSIGSLEHFTEEGVVDFIREAHRITRYGSFHQIPVSRRNKDEGWMKGLQSFHNNSVEWWLEKYRTAYQDVQVLDSKWNDRISVGKWFICTKARP